MEPNDWCWCGVMTNTEDYSCWNNYCCKKKKKLGKVAEPFEVNTEMIVANSKIEMEVMAKLCQCILD